MGTTKKKSTGTKSSKEILGGSSLSRRTTTYKEPTWVCQYCGTSYKSEDYFMQHKCNQMQRAQEIKQPLGQLAYGMYAEWFKLKKRKAPPIDTFISSKQYNSFKNFAEYCQSRNIRSPELYIRFMCETDIPPVLWCRSQSYAMYMAYLDTQLPPVEAVIESIQFFKDNASQLGVKPSFFYETLTLEDLAELLSRRIISPWFIIFSKEFRNKLAAVDNPSQREFMMRTNLATWLGQVGSEPNRDNEIKDLIREAGL